MSYSENGNASTDLLDQVIGARGQLLDDKTLREVGDKHRDRTQSLEGLHGALVGMNAISEMGGPAWEVDPGNAPARETVSTITLRPPFRFLQAIPSEGSVHRRDRAWHDRTSRRRGPRNRHRRRNPPSASAPRHSPPPCRDLNVARTEATMIGSLPLIPENAVALPAHALGPQNARVRVWFDWPHGQGTGFPNTALFANFLSYDLNNDPNTRVSVAAWVEIVLRSGQRTRQGVRYLLDQRRNPFNPGSTGLIDPGTEKAAFAEIPLTGNNLAIEINIAGIARIDFPPHPDGTFAGFDYQQPTDGFLETRPSPLAIGLPPGLWGNAETVPNYPRGGITISRIEVEVATDTGDTGLVNPG